MRSVDEFAQRAAQKRVDEAKEGLELHAREYIQGWYCDAPAVGSGHLRIDPVSDRHGQDVAGLSDPLPQFDPTQEVSALCLVYADPRTSGSCGFDPPLESTEVFLVKSTIGDRSVHGFPPSFAAID